LDFYLLEDEFYTLTVRGEGEGEICDAEVEHVFVLLACGELQHAVGD